MDVKGTIISIYIVTIMLIWSTFSTPEIDSIDKMVIISIGVLHKSIKRSSKYILRIT